MQRSLNKLAGFGGCCLYCEYVPRAHSKILLHAWGSLGVATKSNDVTRSECTVPFHMYQTLVPICNVGRVDCVGFAFNGLQ